MSRLRAVRRRLAASFVRLASRFGLQSARTKQERADEIVAVIQRAGPALQPEDRARLVKLDKIAALNAQVALTESRLAPKAAS